ncbi:tktA tktB transketolase [Candidatus Phycorickettsia trachydisci]|uniref:Transketolase n=1 Tax=Candidatus Phycorickettsia trachydisci TaxID=2115978 RepID=A0A2P1P8T7_9RICK|nr:transketolase [Candidatus Phycorickettsia trachydisci]AVP87667.1 tktA tktB transketolase [Candidatus Phycorickettsia trachydisci]
MQNNEIIKAARALRILSACAVEKAQSGHPGMPLGFADVFTVLAAKYLKFNPQDPRWFGRDRLVLSAGHGSMLLYAFYYLSRFKGFDIEQIKNFRRLGSSTPGHPEYDAISPVETTTGPLGQGFANSVGMAIAGKKYLEKTDAANYKIYCIVGDGCLMEGISYEAASIAGHLKLNNLIVLFDSNSITIDGPTSLAISENQLFKFQGLGWSTLCIDGHNLEEIDDALNWAQKSERPVFIECKTTIGYGAGDKAASCKSHGAPLGKKDLDELKKFLNWEHEDFVIPEDILDIWRSFAKNKAYEEWQAKFKKLTKDQIEYLKPIKVHPQTIDQIKKLETTDGEATRVSSSKILEIIAQNEPKAILGSADLSTSVGVYNKYCKIISKDDFDGNFIHYGIRENAMAGIMNGLAIEGFFPIGGTFLVFSDYMKPGMRLASLMKLGVIYIMTHDSIGVGQDGPTHQPVEHLTALRSVPGLCDFRPSDRLETIGAFEHALSNLAQPYLMALSRQNIKSTVLTKEQEVKKGAYCIIKNHHPDITIFSNGSELPIASEVCKLLEADNFKVNLISLVSFNLFLQQDRGYIQEIIGTNEIKVAIEAASSYPWHRFIGRDGLFFGIDTFGLSGAYEDLYKHFGLTPQNIYKKIKYESRNQRTWKDRKTSA